jgi:uncharacterized protein (UPF0335 family)
MAASMIDTALRSYAERVMRLDIEKKELNDTRRLVFAEAKEAGFDVTILREIVREMAMEPEARAARYDRLDEYRHAVGILADTPLGRASEPAVERPKPFAKQPVRGRGRPRKTSSVDEAIDKARAHLNPDKALWDDSPAMPH